MFFIMEGSMLEYFNPASDKNKTVFAPKVQKNLSFLIIKNVYISNPIMTPENKLNW
jgi:hypothetical protein